MKKVDMIILANSKSQEIIEMTQRCIDSIFASESENYIIFKVLVIESSDQCHPYKGKDIKVIQPNDKFGFNKFLNIGIRNSDSEYLCLCNNDLFFHPSWATEIFKLLEKEPMVMSVNSFCSYSNYECINDFDEYIIANYENIFRGVFTGWCIFLKREVIKKIGLLDERFVFWYADNDLGMTLLKHNFKHALLKKSKVDHLGSKSHDLISEKSKEYFTSKQVNTYLLKWGTPLEKIKALINQKLTKSYGK